MARVNTLGFYPTVESILIRHPIITSTYGYRTQICTLADGWATLYVFEFGNNSFVLDKLAIFDYGTVHTCKHPPVYRSGVAYRACGCGIYTKDSDGI